MELVPPFSQWRRLPSPDVGFRFDSMHVKKRILVLVGHYSQSLLPLLLGNRRQRNFLSCLVLLFCFPRLLGEAFVRLLVSPLFDNVDSFETFIGDSNMVFGFRACH